MNKVETILLSILSDKDYVFERMKIREKPLAKASDRIAQRDIWAPLNISRDGT